MHEALLRHRNSCYPETRALCVMRTEQVGEGCSNNVRSKITEGIQLKFSTWNFNKMSGCFMSRVHKFLINLGFHILGAKWWRVTTAMPKTLIREEHANLTFIWRIVLGACGGKNCNNNAENFYTTLHNLVLQASWNLRFLHQWALLRINVFEVEVKMFGYKLLRRWTLKPNKPKALLRQPRETLG